MITQTDHEYETTESDASFAGNGQQISAWTEPTESASKPSVILSFDVEEHYRIEAAVSLTIDQDQKQHYRQRLTVSTNWLLDLLAEQGITATFFVVGKIAEHNPDLIRAIHSGGHEIASHSWGHHRVHRLSRNEFRDDVKKSKEALEQITGEAVVGFRAPTFSIMRETAWAIDELVDLGFLYDSSIYPVHHDRYGVPNAPRFPFIAQGEDRGILEIPPATLKILGNNLPVGGGGYFRLFPLLLMKMALGQAARFRDYPVSMLYFHPWEFDPEQDRLPLKWMNRVRTYVGIGTSQKRLSRLVKDRDFVTARAVALDLLEKKKGLPVFPTA